MSTISFALAVATKRAYWRQLFSRKNVIGVGVGYKITETGPTNEPAVVVNVARKVKRAYLTASELIPRKIETVRTDVVETGTFRALQGHQKRFRSVIPPGVSMAHPKVTSGTFGCLVQRDKDIFILSNNHVLADVNQGEVGDLIFQPSPFDGGTEADGVATLEQYIPLKFNDESTWFNFLSQIVTFFSAGRTRPFQGDSGVNIIDAALARPKAPTAFTPEILGIGLPKGGREIGLGGLVRKSGRTTEYTEGRIVQFDVTSTVMYNGRAALFENQLMASAMSAPGDSGSAVLDTDNFVVGLLYAGSNNNTLINPIGPILRAFGVEIVT